MECHDCGASLPAEARFCLKCGARVQVRQDTAVDPLRDALERAIGFQYRIERLLGRGGMGAVYLAHELALERDVAIKVLPPEHAASPQLRERFRREARTAARLTHPNIVPLHTFGEVDGLMYFVMGYVSGESLASRLTREGRIGSDDARTLLAQLTDGLDYAHRQGIVHRDLKPDNILIDAESGAPLLTDFGIAKAALGDGQLTSTGQIFGTPYYMSPEQALGRADVDARSDVYSLGILAYEMVSGRRPFDAPGAYEALTQRLTQDPIPLRAVAPDVADDLVTAIARCLQRDPAGRWPDAKSLRAALGSSEDESDDPLAVRLLRIWTLLILVATSAAFYVGVFRGLALAIGGLAPTVVFLGLILSGSVIALKRQGLDRRAIVHAALRQPGWWRFWYPKRFRRQGDVWDRLPASIRRLRVQTALTFVTIVGVSIPLQVGVVITERPPAVTAVFPVVIAGLLASLFFARSRATTHVATTLGISPIEASKILSTASWRIAVWQRRPASLLLRSSSPGVGPGPAPQDAVPTVQSTGDSTGAVTRL